MQKYLLKLMLTKENYNMEKTWFKIKEPLKTKDVVEYSTDYRFFIENQVRVVRTGTRYNFCSRLEAKTFKSLNEIGRKGELNNFEIELRLKEIHSEILKGVHGEGELVE